ncbi:DUF1330 domain-containing protein [Marinomonas mediterranea]|jgi:Uncharacterized conserved protein|uniref:DUF1330 domain-containing protein n=1 Tax=Marinomonas mediterranea (strain ATCC 700492 / JCM 21426 / NBRC 103028 / MMB-1) TaxID=717774 RepID=F2JV18_MARM1|nr:DUF1330 domain-containing protein [Marinomonas mediterranea]ADZ91672.1 protein of unknown function DUF1330 [Marinomonas mediterranea MMB-1]WCN09627.1 DUF1330 domain-containing protein [Marinomonas mediterranea]WCN13716.1 DUF1330 domain-containing protein [Marinomonas mediterranea]WCN17771.1 DUF1330 domain-containing protein [Marinomonas mediterranea MMB-1]
MKGYWVAFVDVHDKDQYQNYLDLAPEALKKYGATMLSRGEEVTTIEGFSKAPDRAVVFEFESYEKALACYRSPEYQHARQQREGCSFAHILIMKGLN